MPRKRFHRGMFVKGDPRCWRKGRLTGSKSRPKGTEPFACPYCHKPIGRGQTDREATPSTESSTVLQTLRAENPDRMGSRDGQAMAKTQPKRGRPRKYVTAEELKRANRDRVQKHRRKARGNV